MLQVRLTLPRLCLLGDAHCVRCDEADAAKAFAEHGDALERDPHSAGCPSWQNPASHPVGINRKTIGWNAAGQ